jgi:hypothetical protein
MPFKIPVVKANPSETCIELWVDSFVESRDDWSRYGDSPYIFEVDTGSPPSDDYIDTLFGSVTEGDFGFEDLPGQASSLINVTICTHMKTISAMAEIEYYVWDGSDWTKELSSGTLNNWMWINGSSTVLDSIAKVNGAKLYVKSDAIQSYQYGIDGVCLRVWYEEATPPTCTYTSHNTTIIDQPCLFSSNWSVTLSHGIFSWNVTDTWENDTIQSLSSSWFNKTKTLSIIVKVIGYRFYGNDSAGWGDSGIKTLTISTNATLGTEDLIVDEFTSYADPPIWYLLMKDLDFDGVDAWVTKQNASNPLLGRWIKITNIFAVVGSDIRGYEVDVYNTTSSSWVTPTSIYSSCGGTNQANFTDDDTDTYWECLETEPHEIVLDMGMDVKTNAIRLWVPDIPFYTDWQDVNVYVAPSTGWFTNGTSPYLNASDYDLNYIYMDKPNKLTGLFKFQETTHTSIKSVTFFANISISSTSAKIILEYMNKTDWNSKDLTVTQADTWQLVNKSLKENFVSLHLINTFTVRFTTYGSATFKVDYAFIRVQYINITSVEHIYPAAATGRNSIHYETEKANAVYYAYLDVNDGYYKIVAYNIMALNWTVPYVIADAGTTDGHWKPSVSFLPNGSVAIFYGYNAKLSYRVSTFSAKTEANLTKLLTNWNDETEILPHSYGAAYPDPVLFEDRTLVFVRTFGGSTSGVTGQCTYLNDEWTYKNVTYFPLLEGDETYHCVYGTPYKVGEKIYYGYNRNTDADRINQYLIVSEDKGETWKHWNGTTLTTPFNGEIANVVNQTARCAISSIWNDENGKTNILYNYLPQPWWCPINNSKCQLKIVIANATIPSATATWENNTIQDEYGHDIIGYATGFLDTEVNMTTLWAAPHIHTLTNPYPTKYLRIEDHPFKFWAYFVYTDTSVFSSTHGEITDYQFPYESFSTITEKGYIGEETELPNTFFAENMWLFKFTALQSANLTHIVSRINMSSEDSGLYYVLIYNSTEYLLGYSYDGAWQSFGYPPRDTWSSFPLNQTVEIIEGQSYWIGFTGLDDTSKIYYEETAEQNICMNLTYNTKTDYIGGANRDYGNRTASIFGASTKIVFWGLWDKLCNIVTGVNQTTFEANTSATIKFHTKWLDYRGINQIAHYENSTGTWNETICDAEGASEKWCNITRSFNLTGGTVVEWFYTCTNNIGTVKNSSMSYLLAYTAHSTDISQTFTTSWSICAQHNMFIELTQSLSSSWTVLTQWNAIAEFSQGLTTSWSILNEWNAILDVTQSLTTSWNVLANLNTFIDLSQSLATTWTILTNWNAIIDVTQAFSTTWTVLTQTTFNVITSLSNSFTWIIDIVHTVGAKQYFVDLSQAVSSTWNVLVGWNAILDFTQSLTTSWTVLTQTSFNIIALLSNTFSWIVDVVHTIAGVNYIVDLSQALTTSWTILTQWNAITDLTQSIGTTWTVLTQTDWITSLTQAFTTSWLVDVTYTAWTAPEEEVTTFGTLGLVIAIIALAIAIVAFTAKKS